MKKVGIVIGCIILVFVFVFGGVKLKELYEYQKSIEKVSLDDKEIEKKWLIDPEKIDINLNDTKRFDIEQTYISFSPEIRVRKINGGELYTCTMKSNMSADGLIRDELETEITKEEYEYLYEKKAEDAITIHKTRYQYVNEDGKITAIDIYENELKGLAYMEIEFATEEEAKKYTSPDFVIKDVTSDERYKNGSLARFGIPEE